MKIAAITKFKHGSLFNLLRKLGWSQSELARRLGIQPTIIGYYCNLKKVPPESVQQQMQLVFGEAGEYFDPLTAWPENFHPVPNNTVTQVADVELDQIAYREHLQLLAHNPERERDRRMLYAILDQLDNRERVCVAAHFGLDGDPQSYTEIGKKYGVSCTRVSQIVNHATRKMKYIVSKLEEIHIKPKPQQEEEHPEPA